MKLVLRGERGWIEKMQGTEILAVRDVRTCEYADGCDEVAMPGSTCCWRHRRHGKLFGLPLPASAIRERRLNGSTEQRPETVSRVAMAETPAGHRSMERSQRSGSANRETGHASRSSTATAMTPELGKCGCGREWNHHGRCAWRRENPGVSLKPANSNGTRMIAVSTESRDALRPKFPVKSGVAAADGEEIDVFTVKMTEPMLDTFWGLLDGKSKAALLSKMGAE